MLLSNPGVKEEATRGTGARTGRTKTGAHPGEAEAGGTGGVKGSAGGTQLPPRTPQKAATRPRGSERGHAEEQKPAGEETENQL